MSDMVIIKSVDPIVLRVLPNLTPECPECRHPHNIDVGFTCTRFTCTCTATALVDEMPKAAAGSIAQERSPWRGLVRGARAVIEPRSGTKHVPMHLDPLLGKQVVVAGYVAYRPGICSTRRGHPHYHVIIETHLIRTVSLDALPFACIPAGMLRPVEIEEVPALQTIGREPDLIVRGQRRRDDE